MLPILIYVPFFSSQAKVALNLQPKQSEPEPDEPSKRENKVRKTSDTLHSSIVKTLKDEKTSEVVPSTSSDISAPSTSLSTQKTDETEKMIDTSNIQTHSQDVTEAQSEPIVEDEPEEEIEEIHIVG